MMVSCIWQTACAQLSETDTMRWQYVVSATGTLSAGNVERFLLITKGELKHRAEQFGMITSNTYRAGTIRGKKTEDDIISKNYFYLHPDRRIYPYQLTWLERNWRRKIDFRYQVGLGASFVPLKQVDQLIKVSMTAIMEETWFRNNNFQQEPVTDAARIRSWRGRVRLFGRHELFDERARLHYECWVQQSPFKRYDYRYYCESTLRIPVIKKFAFNISLNYLYENIALEEVRKHDLFLTFGASWGI
ncbi:MAG: DUF481 domain-containing protein [Bacteroidota bacterium]